MTLLLRRSGHESPVWVKPVSREFERRRADQPGASPQAPAEDLSGAFCCRVLRSRFVDMGLGISLPSRASEAAPKTPIGVSLNLRNACVDFAVCSFTLYVTAAITAIETEGHPASSVVALNAKRLPYRRPAGQDEDGRNQALVSDAHEKPRLILSANHRSVGDATRQRLKRAQSSGRRDVRAGQVRLFLEAEAFQAALRPLFGFAHIHRHHGR